MRIVLPIATLLIIGLALGVVLTEYLGRGVESAEVRSGSSSILPTDELGDSTVEMADEAVREIVEALPDDTIVSDAIARRMTLSEAEDFHGLDSSALQGTAFLTRDVWVVGVLIDGGISSQEITADRPGDATHPGFVMSDDTAHPGFYVILDAETRVRHGIGMFDDNLTGYLDLERLPNSE